MWMEAKDAATAKFGRSVLDDTNHRVAVFDGSGELAFLKWAAHPLPLALRHLTAKDERFGTPADGAGTRADHQLTRSRCG
jgi:hypothetical protein